MGIEKELKVKFRTSNQQQNLFENNVSKMNSTWLPSCFLVSMILHIKINGMAKVMMHETNINFLILDHSLGTFLLKSNIYLCMFTFIIFHLSL